MMLTVILLITLLGSLLMGFWTYAIVLYVVTGGLRIFIDNRLPSFNRPSYIYNPISRWAMILLWPLRLFTICQEYLYFRDNPERFLVTGWDLNKPEKREFRTFKEAVSFGREVAKMRGHVTIFDRATNNIYDINPSGAVEKGKL